MRGARDRAQIIAHRERRSGGRALRTLARRRRRFSRRRRRRRLNTAHHAADANADVRRCAEERRKRRVDDQIRWRPLATACQLLRLDVVRKRKLDHHCNNNKKRRRHFAVHVASSLVCSLVNVSHIPANTKTIETPSQTSIAFI